MAVSGLCLAATWMLASPLLDLGDIDPGLLLVQSVQKDGDSWRRRLPARRTVAGGGTATVLALTSSMVWFGYALLIRVSEDARANAGGWNGLTPVERVVSLMLHTGTTVTGQVGDFG